jgi:hypothetical protein
MRADPVPAAADRDRRGGRDSASFRPAGKCPVVPAPVKGARPLASLRDGASATLDCHASSQGIGAYQKQAAVRPPPHHRKSTQPHPPKQHEGDSAMPIAWPLPQVTAIWKQEN